MAERSSRHSSGLHRAALFIAVLALGMLVFFVFSYIRPLLPKPWDLVGRIVTAVLLLAAAAVAYRTERIRKYWPILFALFTALCAMSVDYNLLLGMRVARAAGIASGTPAGWAVDKLGSSLTLVAIVLALTFASGGTPASLRIRKGRLALGLGVGLATFAVAAATCVPGRRALLQGQQPQPRASPAMDPVASHLRLRERFRGGTAVPRADPGQAGTVARPVPVEFAGRHSLLFPALRRALHEQRPGHSWPSSFPSRSRGDG